MPSTNKSYRVKVIDKDVTDWSHERRCTLGISLGAHYHEGGKFRATVDWVSRNFESCAIVLCDSLQRFNHPAFYAGKQDVALRESLAIGDAWLSRNRESIEMFTIPCTITRWEQWRSHPDFGAIYHQIESVWNRDQGLRDIIAVDVNRFIRNNPLVNDGVELSPEDRADGGVKYILEELAGLTLFSRVYGQFEVYAGPKIKALNYLRQHRPAGAPPEILDLRFLKVDFKASKAVPKHS